MDSIKIDDNAGGKSRTTQKSLLQPQTTDCEENSLAYMERCAKEKSLLDKKKRAAVESYRPFANAMLATATFAGTITLTVLLTPGNSTHVPGLTVIAYSSSIFIGSIMGCICMISSIELHMSFRFVRMIATILGLMLFSAFYLLLLASSHLLNYQGPFILGSILYLGFGVLLGILSLPDWSDQPSKKQGKGMSNRGKMVVDVELGGKVKEGCNWGKTEGNVELGEKG